MTALFEWPIALATMVSSHLQNSQSIPSLISTKGDPAYEMYRQATLGDIDFITGDYLAGGLKLLRTCCGQSLTLGIVRQR